MDRAEIVAEVCDYLEGCLEADRASVVERKLSEDPDYAEVHRELAALNRGLSPAAPPLPPQFSGKVARSLAAGLPKQAPLPAWRKAWSRFRVAWSGQHPVVNLIEARATAARRQLPSFKLIALLCGLPVLFLSFGDEDSLTVYVLTQCLALLVGLPFFFFKSDVGALRSLRRGRCLEDLLCAGIDAPGLVDTLAVHSLRSITRITLPVLLVLTPSFLLMSEEHRAALLWPALFWPLAVAVAFLAGSYVSQFLIAWSRRGESASMPQLLLGGGLLAAVAPAFACDCAVLQSVAVIGGVVACRYLAIWGLTRAEQVDRWNEEGPRGDRRYRNPWVQARSENPIVVRETFSEAGALAGGRWGYLFRRAFFPLLAGLWGMLVVGAERPPGDVTAYWSPIYHDNVAFWTGLMLAILYALLKPMARAAAAVVRERERDTWETLMQTGIDGHSFVEGWKVVAGRRVAANLRLPALIACLAPLLYSARILGESAPLLGLFTGLAAASVLLLGPQTGALVGLWISGRTQSRRESGLEVVKVLMLGTVAVMGCWAALTTLAGLAGSMRLLESGALWFKPLVQRFLPLLALVLVLAITRGRLGNLKFGLTRPAEAEETPELPKPVAAAQGAPLLPVWLAAASLCLLWSLPLTWMLTEKCFSWPSMVGFLALLFSAGRWLVNGAKRYLWSGRAFLSRAMSTSLICGGIAAGVLYLIPFAVAYYNDIFLTGWGAYNPYGVSYSNLTRGLAETGLWLGLGGGLLGFLLSLVLKQPGAQPDRSLPQEIVWGWCGAVFGPALILGVLSLACLTLAGYNPERDLAADEPNLYPSPFSQVRWWSSYPYYLHEVADGRIENLVAWFVGGGLFKPERLDRATAARLIPRIDEVSTYLKKQRKLVFAHEANALRKLPYPLRRLEESTLWRCCHLPPEAFQDGYFRCEDSMLTPLGIMVIGSSHSTLNMIAQAERNCAEVRARLEARLKDR